jgi:transmembrane sensor
MRDVRMANEPLIGREAAEAAAAAWIAKRDLGEWGSAELSAFESWLAESVSHRVAYYRLNAAWQEAGRLRAFSHGASTSDVSDASPQPQVPGFGEGRRAFFPHRTFAIAAGLTALTLFAAWFYSSSLSHPDHFVTVIGGLETVPLADGSRVTLNTDSELRVSLEPEERVVNLDHGEAYFEVAKDNSRPFIVNAAKRRVIAVGTQFSVRRDRDEVGVVVTEGTVRLEPRAEGSSSAQSPNLSSSSGSSGVLLLPAGSVARAQAGAVLVRKEAPAEIEQHLSWRSGLLTFRDTPLADVVAEFNRYNERKIVILDSSIANLPLGGIFRSTNVDPFIELLEQGFPVRARIEGNRILLTHN